MHPGRKRSEHKFFDGCKTKVPNSKVFQGYRKPLKQKLSEAAESV